MEQRQRKEMGGNGSFKMMRFLEYFERVNVMRMRGVLSLCVNIVNVNEH